MNNLRKLFFHVFIWFASLSILTISIVFVLPNSELHKKRLVDNNFYEKINIQIKPQSNLDELNQQNVISYILSNTIIKEIVTPTWLRGVIEKNIDITSSWLNGKDTWELYIPTRDVEQAIQKSVNKETETFVTANKKEIKVCTQAQSDSIKAEGFDLNKEFCIPSEVRNGQKSLTEFVSKSSLSPSIGILNNLVKGSNLSNTSEIQNIIDITENSPRDKQKILSMIFYVRDSSITLRNNISAILLIFIGLILTNILLLNATHRNPLYFIFRACFSITLYTLVFSGIFVFVIGGTDYLPSTIKELLLPGFINAEVVKIISSQLVTFGIDLVFPGIVFALGVFLFGLMFWLFNRFDVFIPKKFKEMEFRPISNNYKKFFKVPEEPILSRNNPHDKKLQLLKTYKQTTPKSKKNLSLPSTILKLPGAINQLKNQTVSKNAKFGNKQNSSSLVIADKSENRKIVMANEVTEKQAARKIQL
jgi:hypothetical protein